jgi:hypothetical protein
MAAPKRPTHVVESKSLYMRVNGKMTKLEKGSQLTIDDATAKKMVEKGMIKSLKEAKVIEVDSKEEEGNK